MLEDERQVVIHQLSGIVVKTVVPSVLPWLNQPCLFLPSAFVADAVPLAVISPYFDVDGLARVISTCSMGCSLVTLTTVIKTPDCWISSTKGSGSMVYSFEYNYIYYSPPLLPLLLSILFCRFGFSPAWSNSEVLDIGDEKSILKLFY